MKQKPIIVRKPKEWRDIEYQVSTCEGHAVMEILTVQEQKDWLATGYGSVADLIEMNISNYRDWQAEC